MVLRATTAAQEGRVGLGHGTRTGNSEWSVEAMRSHVWRRECNVLGGTYLLGRHNGYGILWWNRNVVRAGVLFALYTPAELGNAVSMYARLDSANAPSAGAGAGAGGAGAGTCGGGKSKKDRATHLHLGVWTRRRGCADDAEALCREEQSGGGVRNFGAPTGCECMTVDRGCGVCGGEWAAGEGQSESCSPSV